MRKLSLVRPFVLLTAILMSSPALAKSFLGDDWPFGDDTTESDNRVRHQHAMRQQRQNSLMIGGAVIVAAAIVGGAIVYRRKSERLPTPSGAPPQRDENDNPS